ncbi:signal recognition particle receptor subunit alpha, partial [Streptomyces violaceoruber]
PDITAPPAEPHVGDEAETPRDETRRTIEEVDLPDGGTATVEEPPVVEELEIPQIEVPEPTAGRLVRLRARLSRSQNALGKGLLTLLSREHLDDDTWEEIEDTLLTADVGVQPTQELVERLRERVKVFGTMSVELTGLDDPHIKRDRYTEVSGGPSPTADFSMGVVHAPYLRVLDAYTADGYPLILAGHTHGGQLCIPFYGALVTNCDLDTDRVKGLSTHTSDGHTAHLHVSAGCGANRYTPFRFACPPEATLLTLVGRES